MKTCLKVLVAFVILFNDIPCFSQLSDSFYHVLPAGIKPADRSSLSDDEIKVLLDSVAQLPHSYLKEMDILARQFVKSIEMMSDRGRKISCMTSVARFYMYLDMNKAMQYSQQVLRYYDNDMQYGKFAGRAYVYIGDVYLHRLQVDSVLKYFYLGLTVCKKYNDTATLLDVYGNFCDLYNVIGIHDKAAQFADQALSLFREQWTGSYTFYYIGKIISFKNLYTKTKIERYADSVIAMANNIFKNNRNDSMYWFGTAYLLLSEVYYQKGNYRQALTYTDSSLLKVYSERDKYYSAAKKRLKRDIYLVRMGQTGLGERLLDSLPVTSFYYRRVLSQAMYEHSAGIQDWQHAFKYYYEYIRNRDSVSAVESNGLLAESAQKYAAAEKQAKIIALENSNLLREKKESRLVTAAAGTGLILLLVIAILMGLYRQSQIKRHSERQQLAAELYKMEAAIHDERQLQFEKIEAQRKKIAADMHDEVSSGLAAFRFYIVDLKAKARATETTAVLTELEAEAQVLYQQARDFMKNLNASKPSDSYNVFALAEQLATRFCNEKVMVIRNNADRNGVERYLTGPMHYELYLVIKEAVANSIKHAGANRIDIDIYFKDHTCFFAISDNGRGFSLVSATAGLGLKSMENRMTVIDGHLRILSASSGTIIEGNFPV